MLKTTRVVGVSAVIFLAYVAWTIGGWSHGSARIAVSDITSFVLVSTAATLSALAARSARGRLRAAWTAMSVGLLGWAVGDAIWGYHELVLHESPFPSLADAAYLILPVGACVAMLLFPTTYSGRSRSRMLLDSVIVAAALFVVFWLIVLRPVYEAGAESQFGLVVSLAYLVSDLVVLTIAAYVAVGAGSYQRLPLTLLAAAMTSIALADSAYAYLDRKSVV